MSEYVTKEDLGVSDIVCECGHNAQFHPGGPVESITDFHADWSQWAKGEQCPCAKTKGGVRLAHLDSIVRREVAKALRAFAVEQQQYVWQPGDTRRLPEDEQAAYAVGAGDAHAVVERLADKRADEIEGGQS